jgi:hypothetical protein
MGLAWVQMLAAGLILADGNSMDSEAGSVEKR